MPKKNKKRIVLLDSHAILHRAYHAIPNFTTVKGEPTGALYGLSSMLISIIKELKPDHIIATFDLPKPTYRHEVYEDYKAGRKKTDDELITQIKKAYGLYKCFSIPIYEKEGYEADDVLGTLSNQLKDEAEVIIASGDMDTLQLIDGDKVRVYTLKKGIKDTIIYNEKAVIERFGFKPERLVDYKGLRGDPSDNIIGVPGIGEKTATNLIVEFGSIEKIYKALEKDEKKFIAKGFTARIVNLLKDNKEEAEFSKMLATIRLDVPVHFDIPKQTWFEQISPEKVQKLFRDLEFRTLAVRVKDILPNEDPVQAELILKPKNENLNLLGESEVALWLCNSTITCPDLDDVLNYTGEKTLEKAYQNLLDELRGKELIDLFNKIEKPLIPIVRQMEKNGVKVDKAFLKKLSVTYHAELSKLEKKIWKAAGSKFNINSSQQLSEILFNKLALRYSGMRKTSTGKLSTRKGVLVKLKGEHKIVGDILEYREFQKLLSTYIDNIPKLVEKDGRLHANFSQTGTTTGRMSSSNPNLQNIPISTPHGRKIRNAFIAEKGNILVAFDYSQIELRIAAILSGDKKLIKVFKEGKDIHTSVASKIFGLKEEDVTKEMRRQAKIINFGMLYRMGVNALKDNLGSDRKTAQEFYDQYFLVYSELADHLNKVKEQTVKDGFTTTLFGRRRYFDDIKSKLPWIKAQAERMAINAPIQGTQADLIKLAMVQIDSFLEKEGVKGRVKLILQIHDEVIYEMPQDLVNKYAPEIEKIMEGVLTLKETKNIPIVVDCSIGKDWGNLKDKSST